MGNYFNPPKQIDEVGRRLEGETWQELQDSLQSGEELFGLFYVSHSACPISIGVPGDMKSYPSSGGHFACPHIPDAREFEAFTHGQQLVGYYAAKPEDVNEGLDNPLQPKETKQT
jgi:hypothetical protein